MVALTLTGSGTISAAESTTNWVGDTFSLEPDIKVEGGNSIACTQTNSGTNDINFSGSWNLSGTHIRLYWNITYVGNLSATNPVQVFISDGSNTDYVTYFTSNSQYAGGWVDLIVNTSLFTTVNLASITSVGVRVNTGTKPRNVPANAWFDNWRYSNGYEIYSTTTEAVSFQDAANSDATNVYGILKTVDGVLFATGEILLGKTTSANANIVSSNETIVFANRLVTSSLYKLKTQKGSGNTDINISGLVCKTVGGTGAELDISSALTTLNLTGSSFIDMGTITITPTVTTPNLSSNTFTGCGATTLSIEAESCTWNNSGIVTISGAGILTTCHISSSSAASSVSVPNLNDLDRCQFTSDGTGHAVNLGTISSTDTMSWTCTDTGFAATNGTTGNETILVNVASGQTLTINVAAGATTPTIKNDGTGAVSVVAGQVTLNVLVKDITTNLAIQNARVYVTAAAGGALAEGTVIINKVLTDSSGVATDTRAYSGNQPISGRVRYASGSPYYKTAQIAGTINSASGLDLTIQMIRDE